MLLNNDYEILKQMKSFAFCKMQSVVMSLQCHYLNGEVEMKYCMKE